ncbi:MAG: glycosyltransferase, partial [Halobaculum sp.]
YEGTRRHFRRLFESLVDQPYANLECVVVDSSRQPFLETTASNAEWITYVASEPEGVAAGTNEAIEHASGEILAILDDDDFVTDRRFPETVEAIRDGADVVYGDVYDLDDETGETSYRTAMVPDETTELWLDFFRYDGLAGSVPAGSVAFRAECVADERFDETLAGGEDYHLWVRLFERYHVTYVSEPLAVMRQHDDSLSSDPENRLRAIESLTDRYPELRQHADERKRLERYDYARNLLFDGRVGEAREIFTELFRDGYRRAGVMGAISILPFGHERVVRTLDRLRDVVVG